MRSGGVVTTSLKIVAVAGGGAAVFAMKRSLSEISEYQHAGRNVNAC
jgi:hypothetical protein